MGKRLRRALTVWLCAAALVLPSAAEGAENLIPVGQTVGLELFTDGVYVENFDEAKGPSPAKEAGIRQGDRIVCLDGSRLGSVQELRDRIASGGGKRLILDVQRGSKVMSYAVTPVPCSGGWRIGVLVRDRIAGLGTVTFYDPETGIFAALGHGVGRSGVRETAVLRGGKAYPAEITGVRRGTAGTPGQLQGRAAGEAALGEVEANAAQGVFGHCRSDAFSGDPIPVAERSEVSTGPAEIWSSVSGEGVTHFSAEIEAIRFGADDGRNLRLHVTDKRLLEQTGGIVQGMSGSPIIQNGKLIGAVTHVLIQDPTRGYGIWIDEMLEATENALEKAA